MPLPAANAAQVTLGWDKNSEPTIAGYKVHYGTSTGDYDYRVDVGNYNSCTISGLQEGATYYFAATAYDNGNFESNLSEEFAYKIPAGDSDAHHFGVLNPSHYKTDVLAAGDAYYTDRIYKITSLPQELDGLLAIRTANNDKANSEKDFLSFTVDRDVSVYVAYDSRATRYPDWLSANFIYTGLTINTTDVPLTVWQKEFPAGTISLPGNLSGNAEGAYSNYIVLIKLNNKILLEHTDVADLSPENYEIDAIDVGDNYYTDRTYKIKSLPQELEGLLAIRTANNDKANSEKGFLSFTVDRDVSVYVAYDSRATRYPDWLSANFIDTGLTINTTDVPLTVWQEEFPAGTISLPGNLSGSPKGSNSNYIILIRPILSY